MAETMRAMAATRDNTAMVEIVKPEAAPGEVQVRVIASALNPGEALVIHGALVGRFLHAKTSPLVLGWDFAGIAEALGDGVTDLKEGVAVWGHLAYTPSQKQGAFAEFITVPREAIAVKPDNVPFHVAAAAATVSMTALQSMRDLGGLVEDGKVLIIGAAGGIGAVAVGIAKRLGGHVTAVCSTRDVDRVQSLGPDAVIDRKKSDPLDAESAYDVVFDTPAVHSFARCAKLLRPGGTYVATLLSTRMFTGMARALFSSKHCRFVQVTSKRNDLELVAGWLSEGLQVPIDSRHRVADLRSALKRQADPGRAGRVVVDVSDGWQA